MKGKIFPEPLFMAVIEGRKTQFREEVKSRTGFFNVEGRNDGVVTNIWECNADGWNGDDLIPVRPRYNIGDIVYLKEPYCFFDEKNLELKTTHGLETAYKYGNNLSIEEATGDADAKWENKLFMPEYAARYFIKITGVGADRLQDISEGDCCKEGITLDTAYYFSDWIPSYNDPDSGGCPNYIAAYADLIDSIHGKGTWENNPFVWVYDFVLTDKTE